MRLSWKAVAVTGLLCLGCEGRYAVGSMQLGAGAGGVAAGGTGSVMPPLGGSSTFEDGELGSSCVPAGMPQDLGGMLALPEVVWARLSPVVWGEAAEPPTALPADTTADWADQLATGALDQAVTERGSIPGATSFVRQWLRFPERDELSGDWGTALATEGPALHTLLAAPLADKRRIGVFTEQAWLAAYPAISTRGYLMLQALFGQFVPPEPDGLSTDIPTAPGYSRRQQLERNVASSTCSSCHDLVDPLGMSLEHFDAEGLYRDYDQGHPVNASGSYDLRASGRSIDFDDIADLGSELEDSCDANLALAREFLRIAQGTSEVMAQQLSPADEADVARMQQGFIRGGRSYRALVRAYAQSAAVLLP